MSNSPGTLRIAYFRLIFYKHAMIMDYRCFQFIACWRVFFFFAFISIRLVFYNQKRINSKGTMAIADKSFENTVIEKQIACECSHSKNKLCITRRLNT
jgi:hypothetical protein